MTPTRLIGWAVVLATLLAFVVGLAALGWDEVLYP